MASGPITSWQIEGETVETATHFILGGSKIASDGDCSHEIKRCFLFGRKAMTKLHSILKSRDITLSTKKDLYSLSYGFSSSHVWMWELDHKESWVPKNWCFWTVVLEKTLESILDCKEIQPVHPKGSQSWIFIGRTDAEAETWCEEPTHWKRPWSWERLKAGGEGDNRGWDGWMASLTRWTWVWASSGSWWWTERPSMLPWGCKESDTTQLNWTELDSQKQCDRWAWVGRVGRWKKWVVVLPNVSLIYRSIKSKAYS